MENVQFLGWFLSPFQYYSVIYIILTIQIEY